MTRSIFDYKKGNTLRIVNSEEGESFGTDIIFLTPLHGGIEQHRLTAAADKQCGRKVKFLSDKAGSDFRRVSYRCK